MHKNGGKQARFELNPPLTSPSMTRGILPPPPKKKKPKKKILAPPLVVHIWGFLSNCTLEITIIIYHQHKWSIINVGDIFTQKAVHNAKHTSSPFRATATAAMQLQLEILRFLPERFIPVSQSLSPYPPGQMQVNEFTWSRQKPPFWQGEDEHSSISVGIKKKTNTRMIMLKKKITAEYINNSKNC